MRDPTSNRRAGVNGESGAPVRVGIGRILGCLAVSCVMIAGSSGCEALFGSATQPNEPPPPVAFATAQPTSSPTPTITPEEASLAAQKATEAAEKARIASAKAATASQEAAQASAEASQAAAEAELAVKLAQGSSTRKPARRPTRRALSKAVAAGSPSAVPTSTAEEKLTPSTSADVSSSTPPASNLVSAADAAQDQSIQAEAARLIDQTGSSLKKIARNKLGAQDAERYDVASKLLKNARDSFAAQDFIAAHSLANKAAVLIRPMLAATADK